MVPILVVLFIGSCLSTPLRTSKYFLKNLAEQNFPASSFPKCNRKQADFNDCLSNAVAVTFRQLKQPHPEVGLPNFEPLTLPQVNIAAGTTAVHFSQNFKNVKANKLTEFSSLKAKMDFDTNILNLEIYYPELSFTFDYDVDGKILVLPIKGHGTGSMANKNTLVAITYHLEEKNNHYKVVNTEMMYTKMENFHINFDNLFDGDKALSDNVNNVINENWRDVFNDVKSGYEEAGAKVAESVFSSLLSKVTASELFGEP
ncbi:hypothetical protein Zmor_000463 [Zophobas morio]|uniref:Protein takeout n=2 Tax=Zophobas morio TaxID=2755281 RepID=A0AA38J2U0_9CUCU|nr:hypothetical protein Zmor_000463 [Zophobas morio]